MAWTTIVFELAGGFAILVGAWLSIISVPLAVILIVAAVTVHIPYGFSSIKLQTVTAAGPQFGPPGYETDLLYLAALATLVMGGTVPFALDQLLERNRSHPKNSGATAIEALLLEPGIVAKGASAPGGARRAKAARS